MSYQPLSCQDCGDHDDYSCGPARLFAQLHMPIRAATTTLVACKVLFERAIISRPGTGCMRPCYLKLTYHVGPSRLSFGDSSTGSLLHCLFALLTIPNIADHRFPIPSNMRLHCIGFSLLTLRN